MAKQKKGGDWHQLAFCSLVLFLLSRSLAACVCLTFIFCGMPQEVERKLVDL